MWLIHDVNIDSELALIIWLLYVVDYMSSVFICLLNSNQAWALNSCCKYVWSRTVFNLFDLISLRWAHHALASCWIFNVYSCDESIAMISSCVSNLGFNLCWCDFSFQFCHVQLYLNHGRRISNCTFFATWA